MERLISANYDVILLKRSQSDVSRIEHFLHSITAFNLDQTSLQNIFEQIGLIDACIHTATLYSSKDNLTKDVISSNLTFPLDLLTVAVNYDCPVFINTDSFYTFFHKNYQYLNEYSTAKAHLKEWGDLYDSKGAIKFINARLFHLYGPNDNSKKFVSYIIQWLIANKSQIEMTSGVQKRDFIYIDDAVDAFMLVIKNMKTINHKQIEIGTGESISIRNLVELAYNLTGSSSLLKFGEIETRKGEIMDIVANTGIISKLGWTQKIALSDGLKSIINEIKDVRIG